MLRNVSFTARQGEVTALVGPSGGGKSTSAKLAARFWDIDKGTITLGGQDISRAADPYMTLVGYFSATRELAGMARYVQDDIQTGLAKPGRDCRLPRRRGTDFGALHLGELTSRIASADITATLLTKPNHYSKKVLYYQSPSQIKWSKTKYTSYRGVYLFSADTRMSRL